MLKTQSLCCFLNRMLNTAIMLIFLSLAFLPRQAKALITINNPGYLRVFTNTTFTDDVLIKTGNFVDFRGIIKVASGKKITVEAGAALRIKNATVTHTSDPYGNDNKGSSFWGGIVILGNKSNQDGDVSRICNPNFHSCMDHADFYQLQYSDYYCFGYNFGSFANGALYLENANIRYAYLWAIEAKDGGLLYAKSNNFTNNAGGISLDDLPRTFVQKSLIQQNTFTTDFLNNNVTHNNIWFICIWENFDVYFPIIQNTFNHKTGAGTNANAITSRGIILGNSAVEINNNTFYNILCGVDYRTYYMTTKGRKIRNNRMIECYVGIWCESGDNSSVTSNTIYPGKYDPSRVAVLYNTGGTNGAQVTGNNPVGILNQTSLGTYMFADLNTITKASTSSAYYNEIGILSATTYQGSNTYAGASQFVQNNVSKMKVNLQAQYYPVSSGTHPTNRSLFTCNTLNGIFSPNLTTSTKYDMYVSASQKLQAQGSLGWSAGNWFSNPGNLGNFYQLMNQGDRMDYYYDNSATRKFPTYKSGLLTFWQSSANTCMPYGYIYQVDKTLCFPKVIINQNDLIDRKNVSIANLDNYKNAILAIEDEGVTDDETGQYEYLTNMYDMELAKLLELTYDGTSDDIVIPTDEIQEYLNNHITFAGRYFSIGLALDNGNFDLADELANNLETLYPGSEDATQLKNFVHLLTNYYRQDDENKMDWMISHFNELKEIADNDQHIASPKAKVWIQHIADMDENNSYHGTRIYPVYILMDDDLLKEEQDPGNENILAVTIYPNPFEISLTLDIANNGPDNKYLHITIYNINTLENMTDQDITVDAGCTQTVNFNTENFAPGYYIVQIMDGAEETYHSIIVK